jgi:hypothetical protein
MRRAVILIVIAAVVVFVGVLLTGTLTNIVIGGSEQAAGAAFRNTSCDAALGPFTGSDATNGATQATQLDAGQQSIVALIISVGKQHNLPALAWQVAIQAGMQESGLHNDAGGDRDSAGVFQMRPSQGWGSYQQVTDPNYAVGKFYDVLVAVPNWQQQQPGADAQAVERSAFPLAYNKWQNVAAYLVQHVGQITDPSGCGTSAGNLLPAPTQAASMAIAFALSVHDAQPGDLMFLATNPNDPSTIHHVFMYLGNNQIVEAPYTGQNVRQIAMPWNNPQLVQQAVRPGV